MATAIAEMGQKLKKEQLEVEKERIIKGLMRKMDSRYAESPSCSNGAVFNIIWISSIPIILLNPPILFNPK
ncbi:unnamed protein product [Rhizophagus irregularis]|uniref:Uncharacterized protein n=1 Tax=Rhizophagus irregularis TaxID=588596 RepID=A0A915ZQK3_9GLOM|nr:unnamed protein product [Rhizophagus irregularis]